MFKALIFSWNTQSVDYGVQTPVDFLDNLHDIVKKSCPDLFIVGLQEDSIRNSILLNDETSLIVKKFQAEYILQELTELSGWGVTTYKALKKDWEYKPRGLRLAVFKRASSQIVIEEISVKTMVCPSLRDWLTCGKGGVCITVKTDREVLSFLNTHLPFSSKSMQRTEPRSPSLLWQAQCLQELYTQTVEEYSPDCIFVFGDLNFRVQTNDELGATEIAIKLFEQGRPFIKKMIDEYDELRLLINYPRSGIPKFIEGVDNQGPIFIPTCKLKHCRKESDIDREEIFKCGKADQRAPSWCDRIIFDASIGEKTIVSCAKYDRMETGTMNHSDHAAVYGIFNFSTGLDI